MRKSIVISITALIIAMTAIIVISNYAGKNDIKNQEKSGVNDAKNKQSATDISFGEFNYNILDSVVTARYIKSGQTIRIFSISPATDKENYDISPSGNMALFLSKDGHIWILYNDGTSKKITPDKYQTIDKSEILKKNPDYIWARSPKFKSDGNVEFISNLPDISSSPKKTIWQINIQNNNMGIVYTPVNDDFKLLGTRDDGKFMVLDGDNIAIVDTAALDASKANASSTFTYINIKGKYIISMSPDGKRIIYANLNGSGRPDFKYLYIMDSYGDNIMKLPEVQGFNATEIGAWSDDGSKYSYIAKSQSGAGDKIAVISFDEDAISIGSFNSESDMVFPDNSKVLWIDDNAVSVDTGKDIVSFELQ